MIKTADMTGADKTIFNSPQSLDSAERSAVKSGEERGKKAAMADNPERYGMARQRALNKKKYDEGYVRIFGHN